MVDGPPYGGNVSIADTSAWTRAGVRAGSEEWAAAARTGQIATCPIVKLEILHSARDAAGFDRLAEVLRFESRWIAPSGSL